MTKTLIMGIGNPILTDDGVGIRVAQRLKERSPGLDVVETSEVGLALLDLAAGYDRLIVIDSIKSEEKPGELFKLSLEDLKPGDDFPTSHGLDMATALELGKKVGCKMPERISIYAVAIRDNTSFGESCTAEIEKSIPAITERIIAEEKL